MVVAVSVVPSMVIVPLTAGVRPTAVVEPIPLSSSLTRKPTNVPVESSKLNSPTEVSTVQCSGDPVGGRGAAALSTAPTAASRLTASGASSRRYHHRPTAIERDQRDTAADDELLPPGHARLAFVGVIGMWSSMLLHEMVEDSCG